MKSSPPRLGRGAEADIVVGQSAIRPLAVLRSCVAIVQCLQLLVEAPTGGRAGKMRAESQLASLRRAIRKRSFNQHLDTL